ncbi:MAG: 30S ribosomal protein S12 methylthiotransferase RimO [Clostridia bacterium]|nr:30S ribosomal protein S12 methylthiotransferase RimO [Clostridia bacterium]
MATVTLISLGCSKNRIDSEQMLAVLADHGYRIVQDPAKAEVIIVNTCGFIQASKEEAISTLFEMAEYKTAGCCKVLAATGCFAQRYPEAIYEEMPEVDLIMGVNEYEKLDQALTQAAEGQRRVYTDDDESFFEYRRILTTPSYSAYIRIGEGCDNFCAFCAIPLIRGRYRSRPEADILEEVKTLAERGVKEFTLIAQDTTRYGSDLTGGEGQLPELLEHVADIPGVEWLRVLYCYPERVDERLVQAMCRHPNICPYIDMPMQHISQQVLDAMNRAETGVHIREVCRMLKENGIAIRTTLMVGFPGETETDFEELKAFVREMAFDRMGAFIFSPEEGTAAAEMDNPVPPETAQARYDELMTLQHGISLENNRARIGQVCTVLVERRRGKRYTGRSMYEAPEIDGNIYFTAKETLTPGQFIQVRITGAKAYDLMGEQI